MSKQKSSHKKQNRVFANGSIRASKVRCIDQNNENVGIISTTQAQKLADDLGLDLVQINRVKRDEAPTCKIIDYGKYKYDLSKKQKQQERKQRESAIKIKEIKFKPNTDEHDLETKARQASKFISKGCRVKVSMKFKGREMSHTDLGFYKIEDFLEIVREVSQADVKFLDEPQMSGKVLSATLFVSEERA